MFETLKRAFKIKEIRVKIFITLLFLILYRLGCYIPVPGIGDYLITQEELNNKYFELNQKYYGSSCVLPENLKYEWSRIPHFYRPYYVFTYSTGLITAITIAQKLLNESDFADKYIYFLKNGSNKKPVEILKEIGIDLTTDKPYKTAFNFINEQLKNYKSLCK